jgi:antitoxin component YwqK of YwqJK toxin-antitoxin module
MESMESMESTKSIESMESTKSIESMESTKSMESMESMESIGSIDTITESKSNEDEDEDEDDIKSSTEQIKEIVDSMGKGNKVPKTSKETFPLFNKQYDKLASACNKYIKNDKSFVYKLCADQTDEKTKKRGRIWLVVLQRDEKTLTNESRNGVINKNFAKFRGNMFKVVKIIDIENAKTIKTEILNRYTFSSDTVFDLKYVVGEIVEDKKYDTDINVVCSHGVHFYSSLKAAFCYRTNPDKKYTGLWYGWTSEGDIEFMYRYENGKKVGSSVKWYGLYDEKTMDHIVCHYENGREIDDRIVYYKDSRVEKFFNGSYISYYSSGKIHEKGHYNNNLKHGLWTVYYDVYDIHDVPRESWNYYFGKLHGEYKQYYPETGLFKIEGKYNNDKKDGVWTMFYDMKNKCVEELGEYKNDIKDGHWGTYYKNGKNKTSGYYRNGQKIGVWVYNNECGSISSKEYYKYYNDNVYCHYVEYQDNNKIKVDGYTMNGEKIGKWYTYNVLGEIISEKTYTYTYDNVIYLFSL